MASRGNAKDDARFNAVKCKNNAKNNAEIMQNNAGRSRVGSRIRSAYVLYFRDLHLTSSGI
jgi:hypothetical protein